MKLEVIVTKEIKGKKLRVSLVRSLIGRTQAHRATVMGLGLRRLLQTVELEDTKAIRGMTLAVNYLLKVVEVADVSQ